MLKRDTTKIVNNMSNKSSHLNTFLLRIKATGEHKTLGPYACLQYFADPQNHASMNLLGLWLQPNEAPTIAVKQQQTGNCDTSYPYVCIPSPPLDLD